jgi:predicted ATPase
MGTIFIRRLHYTPPDNTEAYPFSIPTVRDVEKINFTQPVTFLAGENGSGKSTIIEAIAIASGFNAEGGTKNYNFTSQNTSSSLHTRLALVRGPVREKAGYFLRAESFYTTANYADTGMDAPLYFDNKRIHEQSHGEAFLSIAKEFRPNGLYIFDEPESALSPKRLFALMRRMRELVEEGSQFIIATHSPILLAYPGTIYELSSKGVVEADYNELEHIQLTRDFMTHPEAFMRHILE